MRARFVVQVLAVLVVGLPGASVAWAQPARDVRLSPVEVGVGLTINAIFADVNALPNCQTLSLPCTHNRSGSSGGFGAALSVAGNLNEHLAVAGDFNVFGAGWDSPQSVLARRSEVDRVRSALVGVRVSTGFFYPGNHDPTPGRFFAEALAGGQGSDAVPLRPSWVVGAGADVILHRHDPAAGPTLAPALRMALDYQLTPGSGRNLSGWRAVFGVVFGARMN